MRFLAIIFIFILLIFNSCQQDENTADENSGIFQLDSLLTGEHEANRFDGTIIIGNRDSIIYTKAIGTADRVWEIPMDVSHRFDIASVNKSFIAALVLMAVEEGKLKLEDVLVGRIRKYQCGGSFNAKITIHQLLTHTSGLPDYDAVEAILSEHNFRAFKRKHFSDEEYVDFISRLKPFGQTGKQFCYSNFAYHLLAIILEDCYQKDFAEILKTKICEPLNLTETFSPTSNEAVYPRIAEGYNYSENNGTWKRNNFIDFTLGRRIYSTSTDLYKWGKAMTDSAFLSSHSLKLMQTNHLATLTKEISYGYGWVVFDGNGHYCMGNLPISKKYIIHGGATEGYKSMLVNIEHGEYIIAILSNTGDQTNEILLTQKIVELLINANHEK